MCTLGDNQVVYVTLVYHHRAVRELQLVRQFSQTAPEVASSQIIVKLQESQGLYAIDGIEKPVVRGFHRLRERQRLRRRPSAPDHLAHVSVQEDAGN